LNSVRILGIDPGLNRTGWGVIESEGNRLRHVAHGVVTSDASDALADRLSSIYSELAKIIVAWSPAEAAVEEVFVNKNPGSTLKLGMARGVALLAPAMAGLTVGEYAANLVKKSIVGTGHADKTQIAMMVAMLLPGVKAKADAADALAVAICHAHHRTSMHLGFTCASPLEGEVGAKRRVGGLSSSSLIHPADGTITPHPSAKAPPTSPSRGGASLRKSQGDLP
jgi:crossover junction endodeoxyribonuclease RuvC